MSKLYNILNSLITRVKKVETKAETQPDLSQNDPTAPDYVKNRTHWVETTSIIEQQTIEGFAVMEVPIDVVLYTVQNPFVFTPAVGDKYIVHWDGDEYNVDAKAFDGMICLGNQNYAQLTTGGSIPFAILVAGSTVIVATESTAASHTISISGNVYHTLNCNYLPAATETSKGAVQFGVGETSAARMVDLFFNATKDEFEHALELYRNYGVVLRIVDSVVGGVTGDLETTGAVYCKLLRTEPSLVVAKLDENGNFTMERAYDSSNVLESPSGKHFYIKVDDNGTLTAAEVT